MQHKEYFIEISYAKSFGCATSVAPKAGENFDSGIVKTIEWCLKKYGINK